MFKVFFFNGLKEALTLNVFGSPRRFPLVYGQCLSEGNWIFNKLIELCSFSIHIDLLMMVWTSDKVVNKWWQYEATAYSKCYQLNKLNLLTGVNLMYPGEVVTISFSSSNNPPYITKNLLYNSGNF